MANKNDKGYWFSLENGKHIHVGEGETPKQATEKALNKAKSNPSKQKGVKKYDEWNDDFDEDFERSYGPAPDKEDDPEGYKKYVDSYNKWQNGNLDGEEWTDQRIGEEVADDEYVYADITDKEQFASLLNERNGVPLDKAKEWVDKNFDEYTQMNDKPFDDDYELEFDEWEKENPNFADEIDETNFEKVEKNVKINGSKGKNPNRKDKYGNELVSDEAFEIGQKGARAYLDYMAQYNDPERVKSSSAFLGGFERAVSKAIEEAGFDPNYDLTYQDFNEIIGSVLGKEVDIQDNHINATKGFTGREYTGYQPNQNQSQNQVEERKDNTPDELNQIFNDLTKKYNMSEDDYWKLVRTIEKMNKSFGNTDKKELPF